MRSVKKRFKNVESKYNHYIIEIEDGKKINFKKIFNNQNKRIFIEIGSGKGEFLSQRALELSDVNFISFESSFKRILNILNNIDTEKHTNVAISKQHVDEKIIDYIPENSIEKVIIQHPDPWPKRRHHKNRLISSKFLDSVHKILKKNGEIQVATDHPGYAEWILERFQKRNDFYSLDEQGFTYEKKDDHVETFFERIKRIEDNNEPVFFNYRKKV